MHQLLPAGKESDRLGVGRAAAYGAGTGVATCVLVWLMGMAGGKWVKEKVAARRAAVCFGTVRIHDRHVLYECSFGPTRYDFAVPSRQWLAQRHPAMPQME